MKNFDWSVSRTKKNVLLLLATIATVIISFLQYRLPLKSFDNSTPRYTHYNNYVIFKQSYFHLMNRQDLYTTYPEEHHDLYKYSPAFALVFGIFSNISDLLGLSMWNIVNIIILFFALLHASAPWHKKAGLLLIFMIPELVLTTQHAQSNALMTGLIILSYLDLEADKASRAAVWIVIAAFIKIYAGLGALLFLFYPHKTNYIISGIISSLILALLPIIAIPWSSLTIQYQSWWHMLSHDHDTSYGLSMMGVLNLIFPEFHSKTLIQLLGMAIIVICLFPLKKFQSASLRLAFVSFTLLTLILFNHKSESATFIVAVVGIGIWFFSKDHLSGADILLLGLTLVLVVFSASDLFPAFIRREYFVPYQVKVWPVILVYLVLFVQLIKGNILTKNNVDGRLA